MDTRTCTDCNTNIEERKGAKYCRQCASVRERERKHRSNQALTERRRREREAATVTAPVLAPPSRALRLSVVDLAQQVRCLEPSARDLVWDVASLSPERLALLRSVLADAEEVCA